MTYSLQSYSASLLLTVLVLQATPDVERITQKFLPGCGIWGTVLEAGCLERHGHQMDLGLNFALATKQLCDLGKIHSFL